MKNQTEFFGSSVTRARFLYKCALFNLGLSPKIQCPSTLRFCGVVSATLVVALGENKSKARKVCEFSHETAYFSLFRHIWHDLSPTISTTLDPKLTRTDFYVWIRLNFCLFNTGGVWRRLEVNGLKVLGLIDATTYFTQQTLNFICKFYIQVGLSS